MTTTASPPRTRPLRVVHVLTTARGGGGVYAYELARAGAARGDTVLVGALGLRDAPSPGNGDPAPARAVAAGTWARAMGPATLARAVRDADVVHCHGVRAALLTPPAPGARIVVTTHGLHKLRQARGPSGLPVRALTLAALSRARAIICCSDAEREELVTLSRRFATRTRCLLNGVAPRPLPHPDERRAARSALGVTRSQPVLLFVGSLIHQKHPELAVEAVARARARVPGLALVVAGDGDLRPDVERLAGPEVRLLGWRTDVDALLAASDVVINTSRWEGLSLFLLEALWRGRPIVATDAPGNVEAVGEAGLVTAQTPAAVAGAIERLLTEPGLLERLSGAARARAERYFDVRVMTDTTLELHSAIAEQPRRTEPIA